MYSLYLCNPSLRQKGDWLLGKTVRLKQAFLFHVFGFRGARCSLGMRSMCQDTSEFRVSL